MKVRSEPYRRLVASLPCVCCGLEGSSQAAHANFAKGMGMKTADSSCFPLCHAGGNGCHPKFDQGAMFTKDERRDVEAVWTEQTKTRLRRLAQDDRGVRKIVKETIGL